MSEAACAYVVFVTAPDPRTGQDLAKAMVERRLAACVNVVEGLRSFYWWEGKVQEDREVLLIVKTSSRALPGLKEFTLAAHPYTVPEFVAVPIAEGSEAYLDWVQAETSPKA